jgi:hypothetical protein
MVPTSFLRWLGRLFVSTVFLEIYMLPGCGEMTLYKDFYGHAAQVRLWMWIQTWFVDLVKVDGEKLLVERPKVGEVLHHGRGQVLTGQYIG